MINKKITIMFVDDHAIVREGYRSLLEKQVDMAVIAEAESGEEAYILYKKYKPNVIIMDISLPGQGGLVTISRLCKFNPKIKILVFSMHQNPALALKATQAGAKAYITKSSQPDVLIRAIYDVYRGQNALSSDIAQALAFEQLVGERAVLSKLSVREFEILRMLVEARSTQEIAETLNLSPKTVSNCHYLIKSKLGVNSDIELTHLAIRMNVIHLLDFSTSVFQKE
ncbi:MAG: response regulator transcription factor [Methylococcales bacterium]|nr:response regulator transcription factor [Methylococcales bacterium]